MKFFTLFLCLLTFGALTITSCDKEQIVEEGLNGFDVRQSDLHDFTIDEVLPDFVKEDVPVATFPYGDGQIFEMEVGRVYKMSEIPRRLHSFFDGVKAHNSRGEGDFYINTSWTDLGGITHLGQELVGKKGRTTWIQVDNAPQAYYDDPMSYKNDPKNLTNYTESLGKYHYFKHKNFNSIGLLQMKAIGWDEEGPFVADVDNVYVQQYGQNTIFRGWNEQEDWDDPWEELPVGGYDENAIRYATTVYE